VSSPNSIWQPRCLRPLAGRSVALRPNLSIGLPFSVVVLFPRESPFLAAALAAEATVPRIQLKKICRKLSTYIMYSRSPGSLCFCHRQPSTCNKCSSAGRLYVRLLAANPGKHPIESIDRVTDLTSSHIGTNRIDNHSHLRSNTPNGAKLLNYVRLHLQIGHRQTNPPRRGQGRGQPV
jgi:hypothetical protein